MTSWRFAIRNFARGLHAGRLTVLMIALTVAVMAITSVGFFIDRVRASVAQEAAGMLAADLRLNGSEPLDSEYLAEAERRGLRTAELTAFPTVVVAGDASQLASLYAASEAYPLRGQVRLADVPGGTSYLVARAPPAGRVWLEEGLLARLGAAVGSSVTIGAREFVVDRVLKHRPDQSLGFDTFAPSLLMSLGDLASTELLAPGSRATYSQLFAGDAADTAAFREWFETSSGAERRLQTAGRSEERINVAIERAERFLSLASMIALLLAATAVAVSARRYAAEQVDAVALMKCLGASQALVLAATLLELGLIGVASGIAGSALGYLAQFGLGALVEDLMELELPAPGPAPAVSGVLVALAVLAGFALPAMLSLRTVPPLRVLRHDAVPKAVPTAVSYGTAAAAVLGLLMWLVGTDELLVVSVVGLALGSVVLYVAALALVKLIGPLRSGAGVAWRYGLANIARRRADSVAQVMAFGFGLTVLLLLSGVRTGLLDTWYASLPENAPNHFMINIQREETDGVRALFAEHGETPPQLVPMVRGRLAAINGEDLRTRRMREGGWLMREANLTWAEELDETNEVVAGEWWEAGAEQPEVSVEEGIMQGLGLELGDEMTFEIGGLPLTATLTSVRRVEWDSLSPNFMLVLNPAALAEYPATFIASTYTPNRNLMLEVSRRFPSVTVVDLESVLDQVRSVMDRAALAVQYVFLFTLLAGVVVLLAAVQATRAERRFEVALLRTLGATRRRVLGALVAEFVTLGVLAGLLASLIASSVAYLLATRVFDLDFTFDPLVVAVGLVAGGVLVGLSGTLATYSVVRQPPVGALAQAS